MNRRIKVITLFISVLLMTGAPATAQSKRSKQSAQQKKTSKSIPPVAVVNNPSPEYRSGEVSVEVRGNENPIIRLGLAPNGVTLVELPASDRFFAINPGNSYLVTIEDSPTKETDHFFVIRPGFGFLPSPENVKTPGPATSIIVQMSSGMVLTFLLYPVSDIERNAHRCVVTYDREAIIKERQAAGLATNLDRPGEKTSPKQAAVSVRISSTEERPAPGPPAVSTPEEAKEKKEEINSKSPLADNSFPNDKSVWSKRVHGLRIAAQNRVLDAERGQVIVAVRNTLSKPVQIVAGYPELFIHTTDEKGRALQTERLKYVKVESASSDGMIAAGEVMRFLITYQTPVLGAKQRLSVAVAQANAADEPVTMELSAGLR
jgi:hypothetical protein